MVPVLFANAIAADAGMIPGLAIFGPAMGLPLSVLAAFIERPFVTRAGFQRNAIWFSLQANFVSLLAGYFATLIVIPLVMSSTSNAGAIVGFVWPFLAVGVSIATERLYLARQLRSRCPWAPIALGNILSAATCIAVMVFETMLRDSVPVLSFELIRFEKLMNVGVAIGSLFLLVGSFVARSPLNISQPTTEQGVGHEAADNAAPMEG